MSKKYSLENLLTCIYEKDRTKIRRAYQFSKNHLSSLKRRSGETYFEHGYQLADALHEVSNDPVIFVALLLHDLPLHPKSGDLFNIAPIGELEKYYINQMYKLRRLHINEKTNDLDLVISTFSKDSRIILMRMVHRLNDVRNIKKFNRDLQTKIAKETLHMYSAIAGRLGFHAWRYEMEDICFKVLHPKIYKDLQKQFKIWKPIDEISLRTTKEYLLNKFQENDIEVDIHLRIKRLYSTYRKMIIKNRKFQDLTDRLALRIIVPEIEDCYKTLGIVHSAMHPIPGKLKDYIGTPKENGYRSIHTVVYPLPGVTEQPIEIQIRTRGMHWECEYGVAAHHKYKEASNRLQSQHSRVQLFKNLEVLKFERPSPKQFKEALVNYFAKERIILFDEKNNVYHFKKPINALDFAFLVHKEKCIYLKSVKINGRKQPLDTELSDGDVVEVTFGRKKTFTRKWRSILKQKSSKKIVSNLVGA